MRTGGFTFPARFLMIVPILFAAAPAGADPCLVVYPQNQCIYRYDPSEYDTVGPDDPLYDPYYDRGGKVLIEKASGDIDMSIYQAPNLVGFEPAWDGLEGYFFNGASFTLIVDGFSNRPRLFRNIILVFGHGGRTGCVPAVTVDGVPVEGNMYPVGDLTVSTPTENGNNCSDTMAFEISWSYCYGLNVWAFADEDFDGVKTGGECFTAFSHDASISVQRTSWGAIKAIYR